MTSLYADGRLLAGSALVRSVRASSAYARQRAERLVSHAACPGSTAEPDVAKTKTDDVERCRSDTPSAQTKREASDRRAQTGRHRGRGREPPITCAP